MARVLPVGQFRSRREGAIVLREEEELYSVSRPGSDLRAAFYRDECGLWLVDVYHQEQPELRAFVGDRQMAEDAGVAVVVGAKTGIVWYDLQAIVRDDTDRMRGLR